MANCKKCGIEINDKYEFCFKCSQGLKKESNEKPENSELLKALGQINNNLFYLRTALAVILKKDYKTVLEWSKEEKNFKEKKARK